MSARNLDVLFEYLVDLSHLLSIQILQTEWLGISIIFILLLVLKRLLLLFGSRLVHLCQAKLSPIILGLVHCLLVHTNIWALSLLSFIVLILAWSRVLIWLLWRVILVPFSFQRLGI